MPLHGKTIRVEFTKQHDNYLVKYLATYCPSKEGRSGRKVFQLLVANEQKQWPWSVHHTWQSWRERYVRNSSHFDVLILNYQHKHNIKSVDKRKRAAEPEPVPIEMLTPTVKRVKLEEEESSSSSETHAATRRKNKSSSAPKSASKSPSKQRDEPLETPLQASNPKRKHESIGAHHTAPVDSNPRSNASANATKDSVQEPTASQTQRETLEIPSSSPDRQAPLLIEDEHEPRSPPSHVKRIKVRLRTPSDIFTSEPPSPRLDAATVSVERPSSQTQPTLSVPSIGADDDPVPTSVHPRAPPRVVDSFQGQVLVDREGHVPHALLHEKGGAEEEEEKEDEVQWPSARGHVVKQKRANRQGAVVDAHHPFSQIQPPEIGGQERGREQGRRHLPFEHISRTLDVASLDRRTVAARFAGQVHHEVAPQVESERHKDVVRNEASPVKHVVTTAPPSDPFSGQIPKPLSKIFRFPAPRASTRSPFRPGTPAEGHRSPPQPRPRPRSRTKAARHPAPARGQRQTVGHGNGDGSRNAHREQGHQVPSVDLVTLSHSSVSARSEASLPARPARWSLPAFAHATPWVFDEPGPTPGSVPGTFRWAAPFSEYGDLRQVRRVRTSSLAGTSTPRFMLTPSPARSITGANAVASHSNGISTSPSLSLALHPPDLHLTAAHGLASILAHMSANHGLALSVVEAVYERVGSLREADEVLKGMREAAEGFGEREIERRMRERWNRLGQKEKNGVRHEERGEEDQRIRNGRPRLSYVVASEDGEGSEYSPPETSRAAMWKRRSESASYVEESERGEEEGKLEEDEDAEEGRAVEEELRDRDGHEDDGEDEIQHDFSQRVPWVKGNDEMTGQDRDDGKDTQDVQRPKEDMWEEQKVTEVLLEDTRLALELERKVGKGRYRRTIARLFV